jgi:hypothetical protein
MKQIPATENSLVLRTDFSDDAAWNSLCATIQEPVGEFQAYVDCISDPDFDGLTAEQLASTPQGSYRSFAFILEKVAISSPEHPVLVVNLLGEPGRSFRVIPSEIWAVENNLSIANMGFEEFADSADDDGVFRGFPEA